MTYLGKNDNDRAEPQGGENKLKELKNKKLEARNQVFRIHVNKEETLCHFKSHIQAKDKRRYIFIQNKEEV